MEETAQPIQLEDQESAYPTIGLNEGPPDYSSIEKNPPDQNNASNPYDPSVGNQLYPSYSTTLVQGPQPHPTTSQDHPAYPTTVSPNPSPLDPTTVSPNPSPLYPTTVSPNPSPLYPTTVSPNPSPLYPTTAIQGSELPKAYPTNDVPGADFHPHYDPRMPPNQMPPVYPETMTATTHQLHANAPAYPRSSSPGSYPQMSGQSGYPSAMEPGPHQPYLQNRAPYQGSEPNSCLMWSICSMMCCIFPLGCVALIFSIKSSDAAVRENWSAARKYSGTALKLNILSVMLGFIIYSSVLIFYLVTTQNKTNRSF